ncbi:hypothetical protein BRADI_3g19073v3 [Brachypodium distachyon]|uniref:Uncharacterized protein n=1 Tax=Brachypodium distachyon TaxID=15368 RepID=A0A2K2CY74_BRADI|nr:hypothetical protein BRADI_3g19073v3 [Brachypodium distachyon]
MKTFCSWQWHLSSEMTLLPFRRPLPHNCMLVVQRSREGNAFKNPSWASWAGWLPVAILSLAVHQVRKGRQASRQRGDRAPASQA